MKKYVFILFLYFFFQSLNAQNQSPDAKEIQRQYDLISKQEHNDKNFKAVQHLYNASQKAKYEKGLLKTSLYLADQYISKSDYEKAISFNTIAEKLALKIDDNESLFAIHNNKSRLFDAQGFESECIRESFIALKIAKKTKDSDSRHYMTSIAYQNMAANYSSFKKPQDSILHYMKKSIAEIEQMSDTDKWYLQKYNMLLFLNCNMGNFYTGVHTPQRLDLAEEYYMEALKYRKIHPKAFEHSDLAVLNSLGRFYVEKGEYGQSIEFAKEVLNLEKKKNNPQARLIGYMNLTNSYEEMKNEDLRVKYLKLYTELSDSLNMAAKKSVNKSVGQIVSAEKYKSSRNLRNIIWITTGIFLIAIIGAYILWKKNTTRFHRKYEELIKKINSERENPGLEDTAADMKKAVSSPDIPDETISGILDKLKKFENSDKYLKKGLTISSLAHQMNTNPKYLSIVIKERTGKSFNNYINGLRINYISRKIYEDPSYKLYKISHLAELCGFSSREVFTVIFKKETGINPSDFIEKLKKKKQKQDV